MCPIDAATRGQPDDADRPASAAPPAAAAAPPRRPHRLVSPGEGFRLADVDPDDTEHYQRKRDVAEELDVERARIRELQARLYAEGRQSLLIVLQAMDTGGKDGTIRGVFEGVNPQGCQVWSFKAPSREELAHDFLWRYHHRAPAQGMIAIFNRSHYEDVLVVRVKQLVPEEVWRERYAMLNDFERLLTLNRTTVLKFFLHISRDEQKRRLERRLADPAKHWKFTMDDVRERVHWDAYMRAYEACFRQCSTPYAPWHVVPANRKWYRNLVVARTIADTLAAMAPQYPPPEPNLEHVRIPD